MTTTGATRHTRYDRRMFAVMNNPRTNALHATAARRRTAVGAHVVLTAAGVAAGIGAYAADRPWLAVAVLVLLLPWCLATGVINGATRGLLELRTHVLDERQLAERDRVRARAHRLTTYLLACAVAGVAAADWGGQVRAGALLVPVLAAVFVTHWLMPLWVAGLAAQDEPLGEAEQGPESL
ncbi:hypothetical protein P8A22_10785 [Streptomyces laculatispora]|uniref:Integral membrane protein n=1 Tax=Streptomyces laculatispora TaxID=887464 RepID=A0ABY9I2K9_9ACTN|nr:hypothetical protein [Streptomyces laculatispora]WLQ40437.1 hypothetical protein P8A22_10785 [Streptomyces laculatispora]